MRGLGASSWGRQSPWGAWGQTQQRDTPRERLGAYSKARYTPIYEENSAEAEDQRAQYQAILGSAKMFVALQHKDEGIGVQTDSVYGAAVAIPQIARSAGWPYTLLVLSIRSYMFLFLNLLAQGLILFMIAKEEMIWDTFAGQMYICDFGAFIDSCPDGPNCVGPGGTILEPSRLYNWDQYSVRTFLRDSLKLIFPEKIQEIDQLVDPGEYGVEDYWCRWLCCLLFIVSVMNDLWSCIELAKLLIQMPNEAEPWIDYEVPDWADKDAAKAVHDWTEFDLVKVKVAGISTFWKVINFVFVFFPKCVLWKATCECGIFFLMETSSMEDIIVNSVALAFILNIDEMMMEELMSREAKILLQKLENMDTVESREVEIMSDEEVLEEYERNAFGSFFPKGIWELVPVKLCICMALTWSFVMLYYHRNCVKNERGGWVSKPMILPTSTELSVLTAFFPNFFPIVRDGEPFWYYSSPESS